MFLYATVALFFCASALMSPNGSSAQAIIVAAANVSSVCDSSETECGIGCCPFAQGECCADGLSCCRKGQTCLSMLGTCLEISYVDGKPSLSSSKSVPVKSSFLVCPPGTTECGKDKCCRFPHATCCSDGEHCCPQGYICDLVKLQCIKSSNLILSSWSRKKSIPVTKTVGKSPYKSCPASGRICPDYMNCCVSNAGEWNCCPNPALLQINGGFECCDTFFGNICCSDPIPHCSTPYGCHI